MNKAYQWYIPSQNISTRDGIKEIFGGVFLGFDNNGDKNVDKWPQGGMNEHGLCFDVNGLPAVSLYIDNNNPLPYSNYELSQVQWECRNVEEVIKWYQDHRFYSLGGQIHYADKSGDAVVVSANTSTRQWAFTRINSSFLVSTNFNLDDKENRYGNYPCSRFTTASQMLSEITNENNLTVSACANVLYDVHLEGASGTKYSNIFDPVNLDIYFNYESHFTRSKKINLIEKLTEEETFEEKENFFGITGTKGYIKVNTETLDIQFKTSIFYNPYFDLILLLGVLSIPTGLCIRSKKRRKKP